MQASANPIPTCRARGRNAECDVVRDVVCDAHGDSASNRTTDRRVHHAMSMAIAPVVVARSSGSVIGVDCR